VITGGEPAGDAAFEELRSLEVKTVISVDGAKPDVEAARRCGLRYVHLPHGYDGIPERRGQELAKAIRDLPGPFYIHCHHGKHRSPAAAAVACVGAGLVDAQWALPILKLAGTSENYRGLYESAGGAHRFEEALLDGLAVEFREKVELPPLAEAMVAIEHVHDRLKEMAAADWHAPPAHPDLDPAHEALLLREHFTELMRNDVAHEAERFQELTREGEAAAQNLETTLRGQRPTGDKWPAADVAIDRVTRNCATCHRELRDVPLSEKGR
jgi:hypothetical protein